MHIKLYSDPPGTNELNTGMELDPYKSQCLWIYNYALDINHKMCWKIIYLKNESPFSQWPTIIIYDLTHWPLGNLNEILDM